MGAGAFLTAKSPFEGAGLWVHKASSGQLGEQHGGCRGRGGAGGKQGSGQDFLEGRGPRAGE